MGDTQVMLITGTSNGIGRYLAEYYVKKGYLVEGCSRRPGEWHDTNYEHHLVDISDETQVTKMFSKIRNKLGRLDVAINCAGVASMNHFMLTPGGTVDKIMATNFKGTFLICRESAKLMKKRRYGRIVNLSTIAVPLALEGEAVYASSKSAIEILSKIVARETGEFGITCNAIGPTPIPTDLLRGVAAEKINRLIQRLAIKRMGRFEDVANVIDFFIRPESEYVTGQVIYLGGVG